jgi:hypothetical protein
VALIYTRVSRPVQARQGLSLPVQRQQSRVYAAGQGWPVAAEFEDVAPADPVSTATGQVAPTRGWRVSPWTA